MFNISKYLEKFKNFGAGEREAKTRLILIIKSVTGIELESNKITFRNDEVILKVSPAIKNSIFIKKDKILSEFAAVSINKLNIIR